MSVVLLANVGNSDLIVDSAHLAQAAERPAWSVRQIGEAVRDRPQDYATHIRLPLLGPTLSWLFSKEAVDSRDLQLVLFASDQSEEYTRPQERQKDTRPIAEAIKGLLSDPDYIGQVVPGAEKRHAIPKKQIRIETIKGNPADYSNMLHYYTLTLPRIKERIVDQDRIYLQISGGTPAMTAMLTVASVKVFGQRSRTLYVDRDADMPNEVGIGEELFAGTMRDMLRMQVGMCAYTVARRTLQEYGTLISSDERGRNLLDALLQYAGSRLAFDFEEARSALQSARSVATGEEQTRIQSMHRELNDPEISDNLAELIHSMRIKRHFGDYADLVQRVFRFQEAAFRYMAEQAGMEYRDSKSDEYISSAWLKSQPALVAFAEKYPQPGTGSTITVKFEPSLNRTNLGAIVDYFTLHDPAWDFWRDTAVKLHRLSAVATLRNKGLAGHGFRGISRALIEEVYGAGLDELLDHMAELYADLFAKPLPADPYQAVNELILASVPA